jgi:hypothetical protein
LENEPGNQDVVATRRINKEYTMRFKREDIGLYVATALIGGGLGLLAGAFLTAKINKKREEDFNAEDAARDESWHPETGEDEVIMSIDSEDIARGSTFPTKEDVAGLVKARPEDAAPPRRGERIRPVEKTESHRLSKEDRDELARLTKEYTVGALQIGLVERGTMSVEELEEALIDLEIDQTPLEEDEDLEEVPPVDYSKQYRMEDKPDMEDLLDRPIDDVGPREVEDLLVTVGGRWEILLEPPKGKAQNQKRIIYFDPEDEGVYTKSKAGDMTPADLRVMISEEVREIIMPWLLFEESLETIYVDDIRNKKTRWYEIVRLREDDNDEYQ